MVRRGWLVSPSQHSVYVQSDVHQARANHRRGQSQVINETSALPLPSNRKARSRRWSVGCRRSPLLIPLLYHGPPLIEFTRPGWVALPESLFIQSPLTTTRCSVSDFRESVLHVYSMSLLYTSVIRSDWLPYKLNRYQLCV